MTDRPAQPAKSRRGIHHMIAATGYSIAGFRRLTRETAARHELVGGAAGAGLLLWVGASVAEWLGFVILFLALLAAEAVNTAIEALTDHVSPQWSEAARDAKDLGSFAVMMAILANAAFVGWVALA
jgi:diacylglycerol kinase (ATP)